MSKFVLLVLTSFLATNSFSSEDLPLSIENAQGENTVCDQQNGDLSSKDKVNVPQGNSNFLDTDSLNWNSWDQYLQDDVDFGNDSGESMQSVTTGQFNEDQENFSNGIFQNDDFLGQYQEEGSQYQEDDSCGGSDHPEYSRSQRHAVSLDFEPAIPLQGGFISGFYQDQEYSKGNGENQAQENTDFLPCDKQFDL